MTPAVGLADLARLVRALPPEDQAEAAAVLGFRRVEVRPVRAERIEPGDSQPVEGAVTAPPEAHARFLRLESAMEREPAVLPAPSGRDAGLTASDLASEPAEPLPDTPPLAAWSTLWARLRAALHGTRRGRDPDVARLVRRWARGEPVPHIPRRARRTWASSIVVWLDRSHRLTPFWADQERVCQALVRVCGRAAISVSVVSDAASDPQEVARAVPVLVLGDLGCYGSAADRAGWLRAAQRLRREGVHVAALVPCPARRWDREVTRAWNAMAWERARVGDDRGTPEERTEALLRLVAPTALAQPGLVRALRKLLPAAVADASTEVDVWRHSDVQAADVTGLVLKPAASERWRARFAAEADAATRAEVRRLIDRWHGRWRAELIHAETLAWIAHGLADPPGQPTEAVAFIQRVDATLRGDGGGGLDVAMVKHYGRHLLAPLPDPIYAEIPELKRVWSASFAGVAGAQLPSTIEPEELIVPVRPAPRLWAVRQRGAALVMTPGGWADGDEGSPVATIVAAVPEVWVRRAGARATRTGLMAGAEIALRPDERVALRTDCGEVALAGWQRPAWAVAAGRDRYGLWAAFEMAGVQQRLRWIPPGRFLMGSPESEDGRFDNEGPQHEVTIARGYWLGDTPVTQALWTAVMGDNPSLFVSDDRPVERVSWEDCQRFIARLNRALDGFAARLPTEAEWERACRAGTSAATWVGDLTLRGENDAPELDAIAWYGGNSGFGFDLDNGYDTSNWPNKQYPDARAGTHPVGCKAPNLHGLHDILGNVFEWCQDAAEGFATPARYTSEAVVDPVERQGQFRVFRGGAWVSLAGDVRAAVRCAIEPGYRIVSLGFRLAGGQAASSPPGGEPRSGDGRGAGRDEARASAPKATAPRRKKQPVKPPRKKQRG